MSRKVLMVLLTVIASLLLTTSAIAADSNKALEEANKTVDKTILLVKKGEIDNSKTSFETFKKAWRDFEDGIKEQSKQAYGDIEDKMGMVQFVYVQTPVKVDKLIAALEDLKKTNQDFLDGKYTAKTTTKTANNNVQVKDLLVLLAEAKGDIEQDKTAEALEVMKKFTSYWLEVEGIILTKSQKIYNDAEKDMVTVKGYLTSNPPNKEKALNTIERMDGYLSQVAGNDSYTIVDVMTIILREGLEALLVVIALLGFLKKSGQEDKKSWIYGGVGIGMLVSVILAVAVKLLFASGTFGNNNFLIGGWTAVFAAIMLVYVSYWLHSKSNANEWQNYIHNQGTKALATGSLFSLGLLAFLAVFREGTETVLFYIGMASSVSLPILLSGIALGGAILILAAFLMLKVGLRIPMRPFFLISSLLVFYLGLKFTGLGINSLQNASLIPATSSEALPTIPWLAVYPSWESVGPQIILVVAALIMFIKDNINTKKFRRMLGMKKFKLLTAAALIAVSVLTFTGCSQKEEAKTNTQVEEKKTSEAKDEKMDMDMSKKSVSIAEGSEDMIKTLEEMQEKLAAKDEAGAIKEGSMIEEHWAAFEDAVKAKDKALYEKVEGPLDTINAALKVKPLDTKIITKEAKELVEILEQVEKLEAGKKEAKKELTIAEGAANMREALKEMKEKLNAKNTEEAIAEGSKLEENWEVFEDAVKTKNKSLYEKVEGPLDTIGAGLKVKPLDTKILTNSANELDKVLAEVEKLK